MPVYKAPLETMRFVLNDVLNVSQLSELPGYEQATPDLMESILEEGSKFCDEVLFPLNQSGDQEGCHFDNGQVTTPKGFKEAYANYTQGGWTSLSADPLYGGMGLPHLWSLAFMEILCSSNMAFGMYPGLSEGAYRTILHHGSDDLKETYLPKMIAGEWSGTMCLTEPHAGTDLGLIRTKAIPNGQGQYEITGTKIFISAGDHDLTKNIVHLVLAKLPDAPEGAKGISLFVVPKLLADTETPNHVTCGSIEHKMGIKASATCVMNFDKSTGWLVGEPNKGLKAMFTMMNAARLVVGMQGLGLAEVGWQSGLSYAKERLQMRSLDGTKYPDKPADPILVHPDIRKMLLTSKAFCEGARALSYWVGLHLDIAEKHPNPEKRQEADDLVALMTPIIKAYQTDMGFEVANLAIQIHGGHGYIREYGVEQYARDARIAMIYEGTNGIQALDLVGRKMSQNYGRLLRRFFHPVLEFMAQYQEDETIGKLVVPLSKAFTKLQQATIQIGLKSLKDPNEAGAASTDFLRLFALVAVGFMWVRMAKVAQEKLISADTDKIAFYQSKIKTARFFIERMLPEAESRYRMIMAGAEPLMDMTEEDFAV